jgi:4-amino-4-deoxy-L-arabinose transferase-like glycosyltransferase
LGGQGKLRQLLRREMIPVVLVGGAISVAWYVYILLFRPDSRTQLLVETLLPFGIKASQHVTALHHEPFYFYAVDIWRAAYPLCLFIPLLIWYAIRRRGFPAASPERLLLTMIVVPFIVFTLIPMKQDHYLLPSMPALAMLTGLAIAEAAKTASGWARYLLTVPLVIICVVGLAGSLIVGVGTRLVCDAPIVAAVVLGAAVAAASVAGLWFLSRHRIMSSVAALSVIMGLAFGWYFILIRPIEDGFGSGELFNSPTYNAAHWEEKFSRYPVLRRLLDYDRGLKVQQKRARSTGAALDSASGEE